MNGEMITMNDLIRRSDAIEEVRKRIGADLDIDDVEYFEKIINSVPTLDEKEIIRKPFERVVERLEELKANAFDEEYVSLCDAIEIVKEECGINE